MLPYKLRCACDALQFSAVCAMALLTFLWCFSIFLLGLVLYLKRLSEEYNLRAFCKHLKTVDGSKVSDKVYIVPGRTIFGNNFDILNSNPGGC